MDRSKAAIIIGILVLIVILVIYYASKNPSLFRKGYWLANYVENPWAVYARSDGTLDDAALLALDRATGRAEPSPSDHALAATIITRNIVDQKHPPEYDANGAPTQATLDEAKRRNEMMNTARTHYLAALTGLQNRRRQPIAQPTRVAAAMGGAGQTPGPTYIVDRAAEFAHGGLFEFLEDDPLLWFLELDQGGFGGLGGFGLQIDMPLAAAAQETRKQTIAERQAAAKATGIARAAASGGIVNPQREAVAEYVRLATENTNDPQNTHDSGVLACLRAVIMRLRADQGDTELPSLERIKNEIQKQGSRLSESRPYRVDEVCAVIDRTAAGERVAKLDATDGECLRRVWLRASDPRNARNKLKMEQAIFDALHDCWEDGVMGKHIVCVNGRTSHILSTLVMLDWDERNWTVKKLEQFKNDIFSRSRAVIADVARAESVSADPAMRRAGLAYLATTTAEIVAVGEVTPEASAALAARMRTSVAKMIDDYIANLKTQGIESAIPEYMIDAVKAEARAAITE